MFGGWSLIPVPVLGAAYARLVGKRDDSGQKKEILTATLTLGLMTAGYFAIYVITPYDLKWHLKYALNRLLVQLWPSVVFLFFMIVRTPELAIARRTLFDSAPGHAR